MRSATPSSRGRTDDGTRQRRSPRRQHPNWRRGLILREEGDHRRDHCADPRCRARWRPVRQAVQSVLPDRVHVRARARPRHAVVRDDSTSDERQVERRGEARRRDHRGEHAGPRGAVAARGRCRSSSGHSELYEWSDPAKVAASKKLHAPVRLPEHHLLPDSLRRLLWLLVASVALLPEAIARAGHLGRRRDQWNAPGRQRSRHAGLRADADLLRLRPSNVARPGVLLDDLRRLLLRGLRFVRVLVPLPVAHVAPRQGPSPPQREPRALPRSREDHVRVRGVLVLHRLLAVHAHLVRRSSGRDPLVQGPVHGRVGRAFLGTSRRALRDPVLRAHVAPREAEPEDARVLGVLAPRARVHRHLLARDAELQPRRHSVSASSTSSAGSASSASSSAAPPPVRRA